MKYIFLTLISLLFFSCKSDDKYVPQTGDLIFQEASLSDVERSIKDVTSSIGDYSFTHMGMVYVNDEGKVFVLEATPPKVKQTPLDVYLYPDGNGKDKPHPISVVARLKEQYRGAIPKAIEEGQKLIGKDYDYAYTLNDDTYYCSEYIYEILKSANNGKEVFELNVMTFKSSQTGEITNGWIEYYDRLGVPVPEGELGINPGAMSTSEVIDIIHRYK